MTPNSPHSESTIIGACFNQIHRLGDKVFLRSRFDETGGKTDGVHTVTWSELGYETANIARGLIRLGVKPGDRVGLIGPNSPRWLSSLLGILAARATVVPIYPTSKEKDVKWCLADSGARVVCVHSESQLELVLPSRSDSGQPEHIVVFDSEVRSDAPGVFKFDELLKLGEQPESAALWSEEFIRQAHAEELAAIIYTSGTTGKPKGVMLSNGNFVSQRVAADAFRFTDRDVWLGHLPLCHVLGFSVDFLCSAVSAGELFVADSVEAQEMRRNLKECRPTVMTSVPRLWEKLYAQIETTVQKKSKSFRTVFHWAVSVGEQRFLREVDGKSLPLILRLKSRVAEVFFRRIREQAGLGRLRVCVTGGGPIHPQLLVFFGAVGIRIYQGYGLTETSPVTHCCTPEFNKIGSIGRPIAGTECRLDADGELLIRGPQVMKGYYRNPEATADAFTDDGFLRTGDIAEIDADGATRIVDRKKEIIITSGGKNIAPQPIQNAFITDPFIEQVYVLGDGRKYLAALIVPNFERIQSWAQGRGLKESRLDELASSNAVYDLLAERVHLVNQTLGKYETIKKFAILQTAFTEDGGELTPTLKMKRRIIESRYKEVIASLYPDDDVQNWRNKDDGRV